MSEVFKDGVSGTGRWRYRLARFGFIWGVWTLVGLFFASQIYFYRAPTERPLSLSTAVAWQMLAVCIFAATTPLVLWLARRYPIGRYNWRKSVAVHALAGILLSSAWATAHLTIDLWFDGRLQMLTLSNLPRRIFIFLDKELLVYWLIVLISHAVDYYQRYREGELRASQAQLHALKMQLHPHFLFNALHSISALVHTDPEAADRMISRLGDFLRLTLDTSAEQEVSLRRELEFLDCYLEIERIRFRDRLTTSVKAHPRTLNCRVPNLILQPIVENAVRHGVAARRAPGHIEISAAHVGDRLLLTVRDNGPGSNGLSGSGGANGTARRTDGEGVGLSNTRARLAQLYGTAHRLEMSDGPQGGTVVTIELPFLNDDARSPDEARAGLGSGRYAPLLGE